MRSPRNAIAKSPRTTRRANRIPRAPATQRRRYRPLRHSSRDAGIEPLADGALAPRRHADKATLALEPREFLERAGRVVDVLGQPDEHRDTKRGGATRHLCQRHVASDDEGFHGQTRREPIRQARAEAVGSPAEDGDVTRRRRRGITFEPGRRSTWTLEVNARGKKRESMPRRRAARGRYRSVSIASARLTGRVMSSDGEVARGFNRCESGDGEASWLMI